MPVESTARSVLIVEDDVDIRETLLRMLGEEGYAASACANGREAIDQLRDGLHPDVILLDLMMPVMDGWEFRLQQKADPRLAAIPVLALSADTSAKAAAIDAEAYLRKPIDYEVLLGSMERALLASERRKLQGTLAETERLASLGTLAAGVAHEINNPLAYVMANCDYMALALKGSGPRDDARLRESLAEMREGCERIRTIVQDLRLLSRPSDEEEVGVDVRRLLDSSANMVMSEIRRRAKLVKDYGDVPTIRASASRVGQVFLNLVLNAAQAIPVGNPSGNEIRLTTRTQQGFLTVEVRDTGGGIPPEVRGRIFDPFFTTKPMGEGTGLGLSISHRIVTAMGGDITVESEVGYGTAFRVRLPVVEWVACNPSALPDRAAAPAGRSRILVVDDEPTIGAVLKRCLGVAHDVETTTDPVAAIARIESGESFDLILCDIVMPERSGMDVHAAVQRRSPAEARRMIFLTGGPGSVKAAEFLAEPSRVVIDKPFTLDALVERVNEGLAAALQTRAETAPGG